LELNDGLCRHHDRESVLKVAMERITAWRRLVASGLAACAVAVIASTASVAATGSGATAVVGAQTGAAPDTMGPHSTVPYGVYDPGGDFSNDPYVQIEHIFMPWEDVSLTSLQRADAYALARHRALLVTIEPWTWSKSERNTPAALIRGIFDGSYDKNMSTICSELGSLRSPVTVRWAQEMVHHAPVHLGRLEARDLHRRLPPDDRHLPRGRPEHSLHVVAVGQRGHGKILSRRQLRRHRRHLGLRLPAL